MLWKYILYRYKVKGAIYLARVRINLNIILKLNYTTVKNNDVINAEGI